MSLALAVPAQAQDAPKAWRSQIDLALNSSSGNTDLTTFVGGISVRRLETEVIEVQVSVNYRYGRSGGKTIADLLRQDLKVDIDPADDWSPFIFQSITRNPVRRVSLRVNGGGGEKFTFWRGAKGKASVSHAAVYNYEDLDVPAGAPPVEAESTMRWSSRFKFDYAFDERSTFQHVVFYQPIWDSFGDYYAIVTNTLVVGVRGGFSLTVSHELNHDETPAEGIVRNDSYLAFGFRYVF